MTKYVKTKAAPKDLEKGEFVIEAPNFLEEVMECYRRAPKNRYTTTNFMRDVAAAVGRRYMSEDFSVFLNVNTSRFRGLPFETPGDVDVIVKDMLTRSVPEVFDRYMDFHIKSRPIGTKLIYFLGDHSQTSSFVVNGVDEIKEKEVDVYLGKKKKKIFGKPAVKDVENTEESTTETTGDEQSSDQTVV